MECRLLTISLSILYISSTVLAAVSIKPIYDDVAKMEKRYDIKKTIFLTCKINKDSKDSVSHVKWEKGDKDLDSIPALNERILKKEPKEVEKDIVYGINILNGVEDDEGNYTCIAMDGKNEVVRANITLLIKYRVKTTSNMNFVEGENIRIPCSAYGNPLPMLSWKIGNETYTESKDRITLLKGDDGVENSILFIKEAVMEDRNTYVCIGTPPLEDDMPVTASTIVRIKDKYAALWPFLGICAEVFILCAIILIYEKKRNKTELDESDTDQSPDQKTTPDHGKDSNIRHRQ